MVARICKIWFHGCQINTLQHRAHECTALHLVLSALVVVLFITLSRSYEVQKILRINCIDYELWVEHQHKIYQKSLKGPSFAPHRSVRTLEHHSSANVSLVLSVGILSVVIKCSFVFVPNMNSALGDGHVQQWLVDEWFINNHYPSGNVIPNNFGKWFLPEARPSNNPIQ